MIPIIVSVKFVAENSWHIQNGFTKKNLKKTELSEPKRDGELSSG